MDINLKKLNFSKTRCESIKFFEEALRNLNEEDIFEPGFVSDVVERCTELAVAVGKSKGSLRNLRGNWFKYAIGLALLCRDIKPVYMEVTFGSVPDAVFDIIIFPKRLGPIALSTKTGLRERYKQANLEALALKGIRRNANCYQLTLDEDEKAVERLRRKIKNKKTLRGFDGIYGKRDMNQFFDKMQSYETKQPPKRFQVSGLKIAGLK